MKALFVVNERSGRARGYDVAEVLRASSPFESQVIGCSVKEDLDGIIDRAEADGVDVVFAVGGDGTVHETGKRLIGRKPALGIVPIGSGNGLARHIGLPMDVAKSLAACGGGRIIAIDTATVNGMPFLGVMGVGFDAVVAERFASSATRGLESYLKEGFATLASFSGEEYSVELPGTTVTSRAFVVAVANSAQYGNNARIAPKASLTDGLLDVAIVTAPNLALAIPLLAPLFTGLFHYAPGVTILQSDRLTIRRAADGPAHLDGEPVRLPARLEIAMRPRSLRILVPDRTTRL